MRFLQVCGYAAIMLLGVMLAIGLVVLGNRTAELISPVPRTVRIDCTIAEISPDIPVEAKEQCRKLRLEK